MSAAGRQLSTVSARSLDERHLRADNCECRGMLLHNIDATNCIEFRDPAVPAWRACGPLQLWGCCRRTTCRQPPALGVRGVGTTVANPFA